MPATSRRAAPLYMRIEAALRRDIETGAQPVGTCLPTEHELCGRFSASRFTVRQALAGLREAGLIEPRPGIGTIVIAARRLAPFVQTLNSLEELLQYPEATWRDQIEVRQTSVTAELAETLDCKIGDPWLRLLAMRKVGGTDIAISWLEAYVHPRFGDVLEHENPQGDALLKQIEVIHQHRAANAEVNIQATLVPDHLSKKLAVEAGSAALLIRRSYRGADGKLYLVTSSLHPQDRFALSLEFERQG